MTYVPIRSCIVCKQKLPQKDLIKITLSPDEIVINDKYALGRSCYICNNEQCKKICVAKKMLHKKFKKEIKEELYQKLTSMN